jgi:hypothetical protein
LPAAPRSIRFRLHLRELALLAWLAVCLALRVYGVDWDQGLLFHPDERQILMVVDRLAWPQDLSRLLSADSPWNPAFFAYGSLPIYALRIISWLYGLVDPAWQMLSGLHVLGRLLSALLDTLTVLAIFWLAGKVFDRRAAWASAILLGLTVLHIQIAHFYTVDTWLALLAVLAVGKAVDVARTGTTRDGALLGLLYGASLATKLSAAPLALVIYLAWALSVDPGLLRGSSRRVKMAIKGCFRPLSATLLMAVATFALLQPYALLDARRFIGGVGTEIAMSQGWFDFPYTRQYAGTVAYVYSLRQLLLFGMGVPAALAGLVGLLWMLASVWRYRRPDEAIVLAWALLYGLQQGAAYAKFLRYALPLTPFLCLAAAGWIVWAWDRVQWIGGTAIRERLRQASVFVMTMLVVGATGLYALAFLNVYRQPHTWTQAALWLCQCLAPGARVITEEWDDPLPRRGLVDPGVCAARIEEIRLDMYAPDDPAKLDELVQALLMADYVVLSSQRAYAPIGRLTERYPITSRYYRALFAGQLGFDPVAAFAVYPQLYGVALVDNPRQGLPFRDIELPGVVKGPRAALALGAADESFTVYDHPQPLLFAKARGLTSAELTRILHAKPD